MITEKSCGAVVFTKEGEHIRYVIVQSRQGFYGFPKGHMEGNETEMETALREIKEETGLTVKLIDAFRTEDSYSFCYNGEVRTKHVVYFLAEYSGQVPVAQESELSCIDLMRFEDAVSVFQFDNLKRTLTEAHTFLSQYF